jgi:hypothetical protein
MEEKNKTGEELVALFEEEVKTCANYRNTTISQEAALRFAKDELLSYIKELETSYEIGK